MADDAEGVEEPFAREMGWGPTPRLWESFEAEEESSLWKAESWLWRYDISLVVDERADDERADDERTDYMQRLGVLALAED